VTFVTKKQFSRKLWTLYTEHRLWVIRRCWSYFN